MINIINKVDCCGCQACGDACPKGSISFHADEEGIWYPKVNLDTCIDCHLCEKVCPILSPAERTGIYKDAKVFAAYSKDETIRIDSTSGGIFSMLAEAMYRWPRAGWQLKAAAGFDSGGIYGHNRGFQLTVSKSGILSRQSRWR